MQTGYGQKEVIEKMYHEAREVQERFGLLRPGQAPMNLTEVIAEFRDKMRLMDDWTEATMILVSADRSFQDTIDAINSNRRNNQGACYIHPDLKDLFPKNRPSKNGVFIIESLNEPAVLKCDSVTLPSTHRRKNFIDYREQRGVGGMNHGKYPYLIMSALNREKLIDEKTWTMFDEDSIIGDQNPYGEWMERNRAFYFMLNPAKEVRDKGRFRRSIGTVMEWTA